MGVEIGPGDGIYTVRDVFGYVDMTYGLMAEYLSDPDAVSYTLDFISRDIWRAYNNPAYIHSKGRFTRALKQVAANYGFIYDGFVIYTGPLHPLTFMEYIDHGFFWKDSFAPAHGEYSHAYQWLCIARHFRGRGGANIPALYRGTANIRAVKPVVAVVDEVKLAKNIRMWPWLCDCFPYSRYPRLPNLQQYKDTFEHTYSDSCRCPNTVESMVRASPLSFIGIMANYRSAKGMQDAGNIRQHVIDLYKPELNLKSNDRQLNNINLISQAQTLRKERQPNFRARDDNPATRVFVRDAPEVRLVPQQAITLHGITGQIPTHIINNTPPPLITSGHDQLRNFYDPRKVMGRV